MAGSKTRRKFFSIWADSKSATGQAWRYVKISVEDLCLSWRWDRDALRLAASRDGAYLLRTNLEGSDPAKLWTQYIQLTEVEAIFRNAILSA